MRDDRDKRDYERRKWRQVAGHFGMGAAVGAVFAAIVLFKNFFGISTVIDTSEAPLVVRIIFVVGMAACTLPAGRIARRHGRRTAFLAGTGCGVLVGLLAALAVVLGSFWLFCAATFFGGAYAAVVLKDGSRIYQKAASIEQLIEAHVMFVGTPDQVYAQIRRYYDFVGGFGNLMIMGQALFSDEPQPGA
mgnify:CR=1 FL=1